VAKSAPSDLPITEQLAYLLARANREISRQLDERLRQEGVPVEQWRILTILANGKGRSMGELAEIVLLNHPTLTKIIDRMVSDALVYRAHDLKDRRKVLLFLSDRGKTLAKRLKPLAESYEARIIQSYGYRSTSELKRLLGSLIERATST